MKNLVLAVLACTMAVFTYAQKSDGIVQSGSQTNNNTGNRFFKH